MKRVWLNTRNHFAPEGELFLIGIRSSSFGTRSGNIIRLLNIFPFRFIPNTVPLFKECSLAKITTTTPPVPGGSPTEEWNILPWNIREDSPFEFLSEFGSETCSGKTWPTLKT